MTVAIIYEERATLYYAAVKVQRGSAWEVEDSGGHSKKIKAAQVVHTLTTAANTLMAEVLALQLEIDVDFLWEMCNDEVAANANAAKTVYPYNQLSTLYFGNAAGTAQNLAMLQKLLAAPIYFERKPEYRFCAVDAITLAAAKAAVARKEQQKQQLADYIVQLQSGVVPAAIKEKALGWLTKPDKQNIEYQALTQVLNSQKMSLANWLLQQGLFSSVAAYHEYLFVAEYFPDGVEHKRVADVPIMPAVKTTTVEAFSIDDSSTTEIDDAFSVRRGADGSITIGVHIAAPALLIKPHDVWDGIARSRMSTVYAPGQKITMLPEEIVQLCSLAEGTEKPVFSLYCTLGAQGLPQDFWSSIDTVRITHNLRHDILEESFVSSDSDPISADMPLAAELKILWQAATKLQQKRMQARASLGMLPPQQGRLDYRFDISGTPPRVEIVPRTRGSPLDTVVSEWMIVANSVWAQQLDQHNIRAIFRCQSSFKTRLQTTAAPHQDLGVEHYMWVSSPLRRYCDLINQWQLKACIEHGSAGVLVAPFQPKEAGLLECLLRFEEVYGAYNQYQQRMETYWCMQWLQQRNITDAKGRVGKNGIVHLRDIPLAVTVANHTYIANRQVMVRIEQLDTINLIARGVVTKALETD